MRMRIYSSPMTPLQHIRKKVFHLAQAEFAAVLQVNQSTISRWERGESEPSRQEMLAIRSLAESQGIEWDDQWFWQVPEEAA